MAYQNLSKVYYSKNDIQNWKIYCDSALVNAGYKDKIDILSDIAQTYYDDKNFAAYKQINDEIIKTMNELYKYEKENYSLEIQRKFDYEKQKSEYEKKILLLIIILIVLTIGIVSAIYLYKRAKRKNLEKMLEISNIKLDFLERGRDVYEKINKCQSISNDKNNWINCIYYFSVKNIGKDKIFDPYNDLNISDQIFIIIDDFFKKTDDEIANIFSIEAVTVRSRRSKLKKKMK